MYAASAWQREQVCAMLSGVDLRARIACGPQIVHTVAINADRHLRIALGQQFSVHAGLVLAELVGAQSRIVLLHQSRIGMAASAQPWNLAALNLSAESSCFAHGVHVSLRRIAAMAARARQSFLRMNVLSELCLGHLERRDPARCGTPRRYWLSARGFPEAQAHSAAANNTEAQKRRYFAM